MSKEKKNKKINEWIYRERKKLKGIRGCQQCRKADGRNKHVCVKRHCYGKKLKKKKKIENPTRNKSWNLIWTGQVLKQMQEDFCLLYCCIWK